VFDPLLVPELLRLDNEVRVVPSTDEVAVLEDSGQQSCAFLVVTGLLSALVNLQAHLVVSCDFVRLLRQFLNLVFHLMIN